MSEELNMENTETLTDSVDAEMTEEQLSGVEALSDDALDDVAGGAGAVGTKLYLVRQECYGYNTGLKLGQRVIATLSKGMYLKNCRLVKVLGSGDYVNYTAFGRSRNGPWTAQNGWTPAYNCNLLAY